MNLINIELLDFLNSCVIELGILDGQGELAVDVNILNTDNSVTIKKMKIKDVVYFTEYGTLTIPGKFILKRSLYFINQILDNELPIIVDRILEDKITKQEISYNINVICLKITEYVRAQLINYAVDNNKLGVIFNKGQDENHYLYPIKDLAKYIKCSAKFKN